MLVDDLNKWLKANNEVDAGNNKWKNDMKIMTSDGLFKDYLGNIFVDNSESQLVKPLSEAK